MAKKKNKKNSNKQAQALAFIQELETKGNAKNSLIETVKELVIGVVGGGLAGAAIGKPSLAIGFGTTLTGHYLKVPLISTFGVGMMASGGYQVAAGVNGGPVSGLDGAKERVKAFGENIKQRLYLDKVMKKKEEGTNGMGEVSQFKYQNNELDMGSLDSIEREIARSGAQYEMRQMEGTGDEMSGAEERLY